MQVIEIDPQQIATTRKNALIWGVMMGVVAIVCSAIQYRFFLGSWGNSMFISVACFAILVGLLWYSGTRHRQVMGGYIDVKRLFGLLFIAVLVFAFMAHTFDLIYTQYIDPEFNKKTAEAFIAMLEKMNMPEASLDAARAEIEKQTTQPLTIGTIILGYCSKVIGWSIVALIIAFIVKRDRLKPTVPLPQ